MSLFRFSLVEEFSANVKFTKCLHVVLATLAFWFAIGEHIFGTTKIYMFTNLRFWTLFILACTALSIWGSAFLSSNLWISLCSFLTTGRFNFTEISSLIKEDCGPVSNKILIFSSRLLFLELIKASPVCNRMTLFSALQKI